MTLPSAQRVLLLEQFGGPDGFVVVERPMPVPAPGEVLVKVLAASVQFTDVILRKGRYPDLKAKPPLVLGYDLVGEVVEVHALRPGRAGRGWSRTACSRRPMIRRTRRRRSTR